MRNKTESRLGINAKIVWVMAVVIILAGGLWYSLDTHSSPRPALHQEKESAKINKSRSKPEHFDMDDYYRMEDPREAARLCREHLIRLGSDPDFIPPPPKRQKGPKYDSPPIAVPSGIIYPDPNDTSLLEEARRLVARGDGNEMIVCLIKAGRDRSMNELLSLMERGIRIYDAIGRGTTICQMPAFLAESVAAEPWFYWMGRYHPKYKFRRDETLDSDHETFVIPLGRHKPAYQEDLRQLGLTPSGFTGFTSGYIVQAGLAKIERIAELPWVKKVSQLPPTTFEDF